MNPTLTIIRGLPGSGKTQLGRRLAKQTGSLLIEPDMFLIRAGAYNYDPVQYQFATAAAIRCVQIAAQLRSDVIYADVLPRVIEVLALVELYQAASQARTQYKIIDCKQLTVEQSIRRNTHNVRHAGNGKNQPASKVSTAPCNPSDVAQGWSIHVSIDGKPVWTRVGSDTAH